MIHVYLSVDRAASDFRRLLKEEFYVDEFSTPWVVPDQLPYQSPIADQFYFACHTSREAPFCQMLGQYEEFTVRFHTYQISTDYEELERVLQAIDGRMAYYLGK